MKPFDLPCERDVRPAILQQIGENLRLMHRARAGDSLPENMQRLLRELRTQDDAGR